MIVGILYGEQLKYDVSAYRGTAKIGGASFGNITAEHTVSVDPQTGFVNNQIIGYSLGFSGGPMPMEGHVYYTNSIYIPIFLIFLRAYGKTYCSIGELIFG